MEKYFKSLKKEIALYENLLKNREIQTIFFGGGTPSCVKTHYIGEIMELLYCYSLSPNCEITIECNPNSLTQRRAYDYKSFGINRFSIGVQSFQEHLLRSIGRIHSLKDVDKAIEATLACGIANYNIDLMSGLPRQNLKDLENSLHQVEKFQPTHLSYYSLIIEEGTFMEKLFQTQPELFPKEEMDRKMYHYLCETLENMGYLQYEISNFSKDGFCCRHNLCYWNLEDYLGLGLSAHSNVGLHRVANFETFPDYFNALDCGTLPILSQELLTRQDRINEYFMLGLRLNRGISVEKTRQKFQLDLEKEYAAELNKNLKLGLLQKKKNSYALTKKGRDLANQVELDFYRI